MTQEQLERANKLNKNINALDRVLKGKELTICSWYESGSVTPHLPCVDIDFEDALRVMLEEKKAAYERELEEM